MKTILWIAMILAATALSCMAAQSCDTMCMDSTISQMKEDLQIQVERIRRARDTADSQMTLARLRIAEQLRRSEEDLSRQIESLERYREQLADQRGENDQAVSEMQQDWKQFIAMLLQTSIISFRKPTVSSPRWNPFGTNLTSTPMG